MSPCLHKNKNSIFSEDESKNTSNVEKKEKKFTSYRSNLNSSLPILNQNSIKFSKNSSKNNNNTIDINDNNKISEMNIEKNLNLRKEKYFEIINKKPKKFLKNYFFATINKKKTESIQKIYLNHNSFNKLKNFYDNHVFNDKKIEKTTKI